MVWDARLNLIGAMTHLDCSVTWILRFCTAGLDKTIHTVSSREGLEQEYRYSTVNIVLSFSLYCSHKYTVNFFTPTAGNERFRIIIEKYAPLYHQVKTKYQKSEVIANVVAEVRKHSPGGGFVKKDFYSGRWFEIGDEKARDKVGTDTNIVIIRWYPNVGITSGLISFANWTCASFQPFRLLLLTRSCHT